MIILSCATRIFFHRIAMYLLVYFISNLMKWNFAQRSILTYGVSLSRHFSVALWIRLYINHAEKRRKFK